MDMRWGLWVVTYVWPWCFTSWEECEAECLWEICEHWECPNVSAYLCFLYIPSCTMILKLNGYTTLLFYSYQCNTIERSNPNAGELKHILILQQSPKSKSAKKNPSVLHNMEAESSITLMPTLVSSLHRGKSPDSKLAWSTSHIFTVTADVRENAHSGSSLVTRILRPETLRVFSVHVLQTI